MQILGRMLSTIDKVSEWVGKMVSFMVLPLIVIIVYEVTSRYIFNRPTLWVGETSAFIFGASWVLGGSYALLRKAHVKMEIIYVRLSLRWRAILDLITAPLFIVFVGVLLWKGWELTLYALSISEHSTTLWSPPICYIKMIIPIGALLMLLQGLAKLVRDFVTAVTGKEVA